MNDIYEDLYGDAFLVPEDNVFLQHVGTPHDGMIPHSGRYKYGTGKNAFQRGYKGLRDRLIDMKRQGMSEDDICKVIGATKEEYNRYISMKRDPMKDPNYFYEFASNLEKDGLSQKEAAYELGMSTTSYRDYKSITKKRQSVEKYEKVLEKMKEGYSQTAACVEVGIPESSFRVIKASMEKGNLTRADNIAALIKKRVDEVGSVDVSEGVEFELGCSDVMKNKALRILEAEGYVTQNKRVPQVTNSDQVTEMKVISPPGTDKHKVTLDKVKPYIDYEPLPEYSDDEFHPNKFVYPESMSSKRIHIRYENQGGLQRDGTVEIRPGVKDLELDGSLYSQVRILVDGTHYVKGMAIYGDPKDFPPGTDLIFNTNKKEGTPIGDVLKPISTDDPANPFGALIKDKGQHYYINDKGEKKLSLINKKSDEGDWNDWARTLSPQFLSKQNTDLIKRQMEATLAEKAEEFEKIKSITNPVIKRDQLTSFSDDCDSNAVSLKTTSMPGQRFQVILPVTTLKDTECYAPNYDQGEKLALVRFPHGSINEIPIVSVNNRNKEGIKKITPHAKDAIGINKHVADVLSGADFDGDFVMSLPLNKVTKISSDKPLDGLRDFEPKNEYAMPSYWSKAEREANRLPKTKIPKEMGGVTNLIADMTLKGCTDDELTRAIKHSMVVIDAHKHYLDYKKSEKDNDIKSLKKKYQGGANKGASTLITKAGSEKRVSKREQGILVTDPVTGNKRRMYIDPETGKKLYTVKPEYYPGKGKDAGKIKERYLRTTKMADVDDAFELISEQRHPKEILYAEYANKLKGMANEARKELLITPKLKFSREARLKYAKEVESIENKAVIAKKNKPRERMAHILATTRVAAITSDNPLLKDNEHKDKLKKIKQAQLNKARVEVGARREKVLFSDREWEAVQAGAISDNYLSEILKYVDKDDLRARSMPKEKPVVTQAVKNRMLALRNSGYTNRQIADACKVSLSTVLNYID